jgi:transposase
LIVRCYLPKLSGMATYSIDLRQKILHAYERRLGSQRAIADIFGVSLSFVEKLLRRHRTTGEVAPKPHAGGQRPRLDAAAQAQVRRLVDDQPDATLAELCTRLATETSVRVSVPTLCRVLQRLGLPRKKSRSTPRNVIHRGSSRHERSTKRSSSPSTSSAFGSSTSPVST